MATKYVTYAHKDDPKGARFLDLADAKLPAWAVDIQAEEKERVAILRDPYYKMADGVTAMSDAVQTLKRDDLDMLMWKIRWAMNEVYQTLEKDYIWD